MEAPAKPASFRSNSSETTQQSIKRKRASNRPTTRTSYILAHPATVSTDKTCFAKHLRPRLYLQLQQPSQDGRHYEPAIDVVSQPPLTCSQWMASGWKKCVTKLTNPETCASSSKKDVFLVDSAENSESSALDHTGTRNVVPGLRDRRVVAVLRNNDDIDTGDGQIWTASTRPNKSFEFTTTNSHGEKFVARWIPAKTLRSKTSTTLSPPPSPRPGAVEHGETAFHFSLIDPTTRRHAVLATLSPSSLTVKETYHEPTSMQVSSGSDDGNAEIRTVDRATKTLILATAVWLDLHLGWSPSYEAIRR